MWGRGRRRKKKAVGRLGYSCHCYQSPAFLGTLGGMWKGEKRQLKPVGVGPVPHPHPGHWGQLYPFCWTRLDRAPGAPGGALASRSSPCGSPCPFVTALPGQGVSVPVAEPLPCFPFSLSLLSTRVCKFPACLPPESLPSVISKSQNIFLHPQTDSLQALLLALGVQTHFLSFLARLTIPESAFTSQGNTFSIPGHLPQSQWVPWLGWASEL